MSNNNKQHRCTGKETVALISWPWGVIVSDVERHKRYLIIYAIDMHGMMLINHYMFSFRMSVNTIQAPFLYMALSRLLPLIFHFTNFHIIKGKCYYCFVSPFYAQFSFASLKWPFLTHWNTVEVQALIIVF